MFKRFVATMVSVIMVMTMTPFAMAETERSDADAGKNTNEDLAAFEKLDEGDYAPGEVIVVFKEGAVKDRAFSLKSARKDKALSLNAVRKLEQVDDSFGETMDASGDAADAAKDAKAEAAIIEESLGGDFFIKDSIAFDEDLITCLVSSEEYDTEVLIEKLSKNESIRSVEANTYLEQKSYDYSLNDALNQYVYQTNSPEDSNKAGKNVSARGAGTEDKLSTRAGAVTDFAADHSSEDEVVVAVIDSGINVDHEDLKNMLWTNPGDIGLEGEHGFNFDDNGTALTDWVGHGTHCSGIVAAEANNGKGIAGVASGVNVKLMMCAISNALVDEEGQSISGDVPSTFRRIGAMYYAMRARQRGVNVVATSNSWGSPDYSPVFDDTIDKLGEAGILSFVAASNDALDIDKSHYAPPGGDSPYMVTVGSADVSGKPSAFTNYGKAYVDLFAPGHNILSTSTSSIYFPSLYSAAERAEHTEYYGVFSSAVKPGEEVEDELGTNRVVPETGGEGVKAFQAAKFFKQEAGEGEQAGPEEEPEEEPGGEEPEPGTEPEEEPAGDDAPEATCQLSIAEDKFFTDDQDPDSAVKPASLKVTIHNARMSEEYYLYFPYAKNHATTGSDNTRYSITTILQHKDDEFSATISCGEVVKREKEGKVVLSVSSAEDLYSKAVNDGGISNVTNGGRGNFEEALLSWEEADPETTDVVETGLGLCLKPSVEDGETTEEDEVRDLIVYIDSIGVSKPVTEEGKTPDDVFPANSSYELMSGTSMATPAAAGAYAVLASKYPQGKEQNGSEYARENRARLFSIVRQSDDLKDLCSTGGYIDLSLVDNAAGNSSIEDAVCDLDKETLTLYGTGLTSDLKLTYRIIAETGSDEKELPGGMKVSFAKDGKTLTISGAKKLFGSYVEFILRSGETVRARGSFFTVKGQKSIPKIMTEEHKETYGNDSNSIPPRQLLTDTEGKDLYAYQSCTDSLFEKTAGVLYKYDGTKFNVYNGTSLNDALFDHYEKELGYDRHQITRGLKATPELVRQPLYENNVLYDLVNVEYTPYQDAEEEKIERKTFLAALDYTSKSPAWTFKEIQPVEDTLDGIDGVSERTITYCIMDGKIYCFGTTSDTEEEITDDNNFTFACALDVKSGKWERKEDLENVALKEVSAYISNGKIWIMFGADGTDASRSVYTFDGSAWKKEFELPFVGRTSSEDAPVVGNAVPVKEGLILFDFSIEGAGNVSLLNTATGKFTPLYYTIGNGLSEPAYINGGTSAVETTDGIYYIMLNSDTGQIYRFDLYRLPKTSYAYTPTYKSVNPIKVTKKNVTIKAKKVKKQKAAPKTVKKTAVKVKDASGKVTYKRDKIKCSKKLLKDAKKKVKINTKTGKVTIKKGLKKGKYTVTVKVTAAGDLIYKKAVKKATFKITVK